MADLNIVPASVLADSSVDTNATNGVSGEAITAGDPVRVNSAGKVVHGQADSQDNANLSGIALNSAEGPDQPIQYTDEGLIELGLTIDDGTIIVLSATKGKWAESADLSPGNFVTVGGVIVGNKLRLGIIESAVAKP